MEESQNMVSSENNCQTPVKKKKHGWMVDFLMHAVDKVFYQVYDGEPVVNSKVKRLNSRENILEEEVLFCKNNVCVHDILSSKEYEDFGEKHLPGYMNMKKIFRSDNEISDLMLSWVPNTLLTVGSTEEAEILSSPDVSNIRASNTSLDNPFLHDDSATPLRLNESVNIQDFETPLGDVFSINLIDVKTVKLFYTNSEKDFGQFVICSKENEYKVFHFHNGGLIKLTEIFDLWNGCMRDADINADEDGQQVYYVGNLKESMDEGRECHPEEGRYKPMNMNRWLSTINHLGQIEDAHNFRKHVFFGGLSQEVRPDAWKYLLYYYPMQSTVKDREVSKEQKRKWYENIQEKRLSLSGEEYESFWKTTQFTVDKDVVRTDRSHPYYAGQHNPNIDKMRNILLNYAYYNPAMGYTQGMSDLVAPLIATLHDESDSFWCFVGLMEFSMFATTPTDKSMDKSLGFLRELLRIMLPEFYMHCLCNDFDLNLLFAHRWLVLCFKREFIFHEVLKIWETCWARYQTDYFHIFICVAIVSLYGNICLEKKMDAVEILQYFTDMAMKFDGAATLTEGRSLLYKFRQLRRVPCSLRGLLAGKGVWDGGITPEIECVTHNKKCCFEFAKQISSTGLHDTGADKVTAGPSSGLLAVDRELTTTEYKTLIHSSGSGYNGENEIPILEKKEELSSLLQKDTNSENDQTSRECGNEPNRNSVINSEICSEDKNSIGDKNISDHIGKEVSVTGSENEQIENSSVHDDFASSLHDEVDGATDIASRDDHIAHTEDEANADVNQENGEQMEFSDRILKDVEELSLKDEAGPDGEFVNAKIY